MITEAITASLPPDWALCNLIHIDPEWQVNICDGEHVVVATGSTIEDAFVSATIKTTDSANYFGRLFSLGRVYDRSEASPYSALAEALGFAPKPIKIRRR